MIKASRISSSFGSVFIATVNDVLSSVEFNYLNKAEFEKLEYPEVEPATIAKVLSAIEYGIVDPNQQVHLTGTPFQELVWKYLRTIPAGQTVTYKDVAQAVGSNAIRAIGTACGRNPIAVIIPCHRVIRADGSQGEYRWGAGIKKKLLKREQP